MDIEDKIMSVVRKHKAIFVAEVAREIDLSPDTVRDIAVNLAKEGLIEVREKGIGRLLVAVNG